MKRKDLRLKKLALNRETIAKLSDAELVKAQGALPPTGDTYNCGTNGGCGPGTGVYCG